jgi:hypothetical protein
MKNVAWAVFWYWIGSCLLAGASEGHYFKTCPDAGSISPAEVALTILTMPAIIGFALTAPSPPYTCEQMRRR